jgi:hypothetical protein
MLNESRLLTTNWDLYDTRHVVYKPKKITAKELETGYWQAYEQFYRWSNILKSSQVHADLKHKLKHLFYTGGWKKAEPLWKVVINTGGLAKMLPFLEMLLTEVESTARKKPGPLPSDMTGLSRRIKGL